MQNGQTPSNVHKRLVGMGTVIALGLQKGSTVRLVLRIPLRCRESLVNKFHRAGVNSQDGGREVK